MERGEEVQSDRSLLGCAMGMHSVESQVGRILETRAWNMRRILRSADLWEVFMQRIPLILFH